MFPPSEDIKDLLEAESSLGLVSATNLFVSKIPLNAPDECVAVFDSPGMAPEVNYVYDKPGVQVRVRAEKGKYKNGYSLAADIKTALHATANVTVNGARYIGIWAEGDPIPIGSDDSDRPEFTVNFRIHRTG